jgi:hypothetical protein
MSNIEFYKAYLKAVRASECLLTAYAKEDAASAKYYRDDAVDELRKLAADLGFELAPVATSNERSAA